MYYALVFKIGKTKEFITDENMIEKMIGKELFDSLKKIKDRLHLSLSLATFEEQCFDLNKISMKNCLFLRVYERRNKFRFLINKPPTGHNRVIRDSSSCVIPKYNGYQVVKIEKKVI